MEKLDDGVKKSFLSAIAYQEDLQEPMVFNGFYIEKATIGGKDVYVALSMVPGMMAEDLKWITADYDIYVADPKED